MKTQCDRLHEALKQGPVNPMQAWAELGIYRLGARIYDLREHHSVPIQKRTVKVKNRFGEECRVAEYYLGE